MTEPTVIAQQPEFVVDLEIAARQTELHTLVRERQFNEALRKGRALCQYTARHRQKHLVSHLRSLMSVAELAWECQAVDLAARCYQSMLRCCLEEYPNVDPEMRERVTWMEAAALQGRGRVHLRKGEVEPALQSFQESYELFRVLQDGHRTGQLLQSLADTYGRLEQLEKALDCQGRACEFLQVAPHDPEFNQALIKLASLLQRLERPQEAIVFLRQALRNCSTEKGPRCETATRVRTDLLRLLELVGEFHEAEQLVADHRDLLDPADPEFDACKDRIRQLRRQSRPALEEPRPVPAWLSQARLALEEGRRREALEKLREVRQVPGCRRLPEVRQLWQEASQVCARSHLQGGSQDWEAAAHPAAVSAMALHPEGKIVATAGAEGQVALWSLSDGEEQMVHRAHRNGVRGLAFSADGQRLLTAGPRELKTWDLASRQCLRNLEVAELRAVCWTDYGHWAFVATAGSVDLWDLQEGDLARSLDVRNATCLALSPEERTLYVGHPGGVYRVDVQSGKVLGLLEHAGVTTVCVSPDGRTLAAQGGSQVSVWSVATSELRLTLPLPPAEGLRLSPDGSMLLHSAQRLTQVWNVAGELPLLSWSVPLAGRLLLSLEAQTLVLGAGDGRVHAFELDWDLEPREGCDWDERAQPFLDNFLIQQTPRVASLTGARTGPPARRGRAFWNQAQLDALFAVLRGAGLGWIERGEVLRRIQPA